MPPAYTALKARRSSIYHLEHMQAIASWDRMTNMPPGGAKARAAAQGELEAVIQRMQNDPELDTLLGQAAAETLDAADAANLALMRHERLVARAIPEELTIRRAKAVGAASQAWGAAKAANDWPGFADALKPLVEIVRDGANRLGDAMGLSAYDALLDRFDRGLCRTRVSELFGDVASWLPDLIRDIRHKQAAEPVIALTGPFDIDAQKQVCRATMEKLGFDFNAGRLDVSAHPFTGGTSEDVRLTTRYREAECFQSLLGIVHETGHGLYQANLPEAWRGQPLGEPCSASMHEAQALSFERQLAPGLPFARQLSHLLTDAFGAQPGFASANLVTLMTRVKPGFIRVEADEVTYPAHIILRVEIEQALIGGAIGVDDIPAWWDERMQALLGVDTRGDFTHGPLQDIHWSQGMFGYFPAYLLGAMIAAQLNQAFRRAHPDFEAKALGGDFTDLTAWLRRKIWSEGARYTTEVLVQQATGVALSADALRAHLVERYLGPGQSRGQA